MVPFTTLSYQTVQPPEKKYHNFLTGAAQFLVVLAGVVHVAGRNELSAATCASATIGSCSGITRARDGSGIPRRTKQCSAASDPARLRDGRDEPGAMRGGEDLEVFDVLRTVGWRGDERGRRRRKDSTGSGPINLHVTDLARLTNRGAANKSESEKYTV